MVCTFFGHSDCYGLDAAVLQQAIEELILQGVDTFYVGNQGHFDAMVFACLQRLKEKHQHITFAVVLAYLPTQKSTHDPYDGDSLFPEGLEEGPPRFAIDRRNKWMLDHAQHCLCYVNRPQGGAYRFAKQAARKGLTIRNLGSMDL